MTSLLRLYPRAWRQRYGEEVASLLVAEPRSFRLFLDLIAGAIDAWLKPQWTPAVSPSPSSTSGGQQIMSSTFRMCSRSGFSNAEMRQSAAWMLGGSLGFATMAVVLQLWFGQTILSQTLLYSSYPLALILSSQCTYLKRYSRAARWTILGATLLAMFLFFLGVTWLAHRI